MSFHQEPVKFNDHDDQLPTYGGPSRKTPVSSGFTMPGISRPVSGITVSEYDSEENEYGQTRAQSLAHRYRQSTGSTINSDVDPAATHDAAYPQQQYDHEPAASVYPYGGSTDGMTYVDENFNSYSSRRKKKAEEQREEEEEYSPTEPTSTRSLQQSFQDLEYSDPHALPGPLRPEKKKSRIRNLFGGHDDGRYPLEQRIEAKRRGTLMRQSRPYVCWALTATMTGILIYELVFNAHAQGTPFSMKPFVNPLLGPSQAAMIQVGARFAPCMKDVTQVPKTLQLGCSANVNNPPTILCTVEQLCAHGGFGNGNPNQWWRFITPIFLHAGLVHLLVNMFVQMTISAQVEKEVGSPSFVLIYFAAGIFGNVFGGNFAMVGLPSVGASGAIFGTVGSMWVDLIAHWRFEHRPGTKLATLFFELFFGIALGFLPGVDNFAHTGGFLLGLLSSVALYPIISETRRHASIILFARVAAIAIGFVLYFVLIRNFYTSDPYAACTWCRYLSCIPSAMNDHCQGTGISTTA